MNLALAALNSRGFCFDSAASLAVRATNKTEKPSKKCWLNSSDAADRHFV
jgi:hypothetical protein